MDEMPWQRVEPPYYWDAIDDFIIADRYLPDGTRQHLVLGTVRAGRVVRNAQIIGLADGALRLREGPLSVTLSQPGARPDELVKMEDGGYVSRVSRVTMRRAVAGELSPNGNPLRGLWVLRKHNGELLGFHQYRNDLAAHYGLRIADPAHGEAGFLLPEYWDVLKLPEQVVTVFVAPPGAGGGSVWIDWSRRVFGPGQDPTEAPSSNRSYKGRSWKTQIQHDAIRWYLDNQD